jgi:SAM-dependent methyltransferase
VTAPRNLAAEQEALWNGPGGASWLAAYERIERSIGGFSADAMAEAAARPGERVLDVGCGTGATTAELAARVAPGGSALGVDISRILIEAARAQKAAANLSFAVGDVTAFPFEARSFDLVFSRFGVMFFADPVAAFGNLRRALAPSGRLVFVCWRTPRENPWGLVPFKAAAPHLPPVERPGPEDPGQYAFGDRARVERILMEAGFATPSFRPLDRDNVLGKDIEEALLNIGRFGPLARLFADAASEQVARAKAAVAAALAPHAGPAGVVLAAACWLVSAKSG